MAAGLSVSCKVDGLGPVLAAMRGMKLGMRNRALNRGITKCCRIGRKAARAKLKTKSGEGVLKRSIDFKVSVKGERIVGIIGPARGFKQQIGVNYKGDPIYEDPVKIAHLVENGRKAITITKKTVLSDGRIFYGKEVAKFEGRPFMRPAWDENKHAFPKIIADECWLEVAKWARA